MCLYKPHLVPGLTQSSYKGSIQRKNTPNPSLHLKCCFHFMRWEFERSAAESSVAYSHDLELTTIDQKFISKYLDDRLIVMYWSKMWTFSSFQLLQCDYLLFFFVFCSHKMNIWGADTTSDFILFRGTIKSVTPENISKLQCYITLWKSMASGTQSIKTPKSPFHEQSPGYLTVDPSH